MTETSPGRTAYEAHLHAEAAVALRSEKARAMAVQGKGWDTLPASERRVWEDTERAVLSHVQIGLAPPIQLGPGISMRGLPGGGTSFEYAGPAPSLTGHGLEATDLRPCEGEPGWHDVTCGSCGAEFSTNFTVDQMECAECEARRCPNCRTWFGSEE